MTTASNTNYTDIQAGCKAISALRDLRVLAAWYWQATAGHHRMMLVQHDACIKVCPNFDNLDYDLTESEQKAVAEACEPHCGEAKREWDASQEAMAAFAQGVTEWSAAMCQAMGRQNPLEGIDISDPMTIIRLLYWVSLGQEHPIPSSNSCLTSSTAASAYMERRRDFPLASNDSIMVFADFGKLPTASVRIVNRDSGETVGHMFAGSWADLGREVKAEYRGLDSDAEWIISSMSIHALYN